MSIGALEKIPKTGSVTAERLAAEVGSKKSMIGKKVRECFGKQHTDLTIVRMMRMIVAEGDISEVAPEEYAVSRSRWNYLRCQEISTARQISFLSNSTFLKR